MHCGNHIAKKLSLESAFRLMSRMDGRQTGSNRVDEKPACITERLKNGNFANLPARVAVCG
jgi:hypothetical protein